jgi:hypothetical protein
MSFLGRGVVRGRLFQNLTADQTGCVYVHQIRSNAFLVSRVFDRGGYQLHMQCQYAVPSYCPIQSTRSFLSFILHWMTLVGVQNKERDNQHIHAGSQPPSSRRKSGFGIVFVVDPNDVYLSRFRLVWSFSRMTDHSPLIV